MQKDHATLQLFVALHTDFRFVYKVVQIVVEFLLHFMHYIEQEQRTY